MSRLVVVRGGGDIATGVVHSLKAEGFLVVVLEAERPSAIRRRVCFSEAVYEGRCQVEGEVCTLVNDLQEMEECFAAGETPLFVDEKGGLIPELKPDILVDAILAKKNLGTTLDMAPIVLGIGPGFRAGSDVLAGIESMRGEDLGRVLYQGCAMANTGIPGIIGGYGKERVLHSEEEGILKGIKSIGDLVQKGDVIATIQEVPVLASLDGTLRGLIRDGFHVTKGLKIADIDPRSLGYAHCCTISDKARAIGAGVLEAIAHFSGRTFEAGLGNP